MTESLFPDLEPDEAPEPENLGRGARRQALIARRITFGEHPLGSNLRLHPEAARERTGAGLRCGTCAFRVLIEHHNRTYPKCYFGNGYRVSGCESSDVRAWWPACRDYEAADPDA